MASDKILNQQLKIIQTTEETTQLSPFQQSFSPRYPG